MIPTSWIPFVVVAVCGAVVPGPCGYAPDPAYDCSAGDPCGVNMACVIVDDGGDGSAGRGFCRSADIACEDRQTLCTVPGLERSGVCVDDDEFATSSTHCGDCFQRCRGAAECVDGACVDEIAQGLCVPARGNFDCTAGEGCTAEGEGGVCKEGAAGAGKTLDACDDGGDCDGGLCAFSAAGQGVCTRPCDFGCPPTTTCEADAIPGGLCVPVEAEGCFE